MKSGQASRSGWLKLGCVVLVVLVGYFGYQWLSSVSKAEDEGGELLVGPYLNSVGADGAKVIWFSRNEDMQASVKVKSKSWSKEFHAEVRGIPDEKAFLYVAEITGLKADRQYSYLLVSQREQIRGRFRTLPLSTKQNFTFALYGDSRTEIENHKIVAEAVAADKPLFVLHSGDYVSDGLEFEQWPGEFFGPAAELLRDVPFWPTRGNHDVGGQLYQFFFELPGQELYYGFDCGAASFIILDSNLKDDAQLAQVKWLKKHLAQLRTRRENSWIFVLLHAPMFNIGGHNSGWGHADILPLLQEAKVDFVLAGHSHLYERILPVRSENGGVMQHIVSGGGGAPLYEAKASPLLANGIGVSAHHYCLVEVGAKSVSVVVKKPDGEIIDRFKVVRHKSEADGLGNLVFEQKADEADVEVPAISYQQALYYQRVGDRVEEATDKKNPGQTGGRE